MGTLPLLATVYLELQGGKARSLDLVAQGAGGRASGLGAPILYPPRPRPLAPRSTEAERARHAEFVAQVLKDKAIWRTLAPPPT